MLALVLAFAMCSIFSGCGKEGTTEETVAITEPAEEQAAEDSSGKADAEQSEDGDGENTGKTEADKKAGSQYEEIYRDCTADMKDAKDKAVSELKDKSGSLSKSDLYDATQAKIDDLKEIYNDGKDKMIDAMLASTEDDVKAYNKWFSKMSEDYSDYSREITEVYTDQF